MAPDYVPALFPLANWKRMGFLLADFHFGAFFPCSSDIMKAITYSSAALCIFKMYLHHEDRLKYNMYGNLYLILYLNAHRGATAT